MHKWIYKADAFTVNLGLGEFLVQSLMKIGRKLSIYPASDALRACYCGDEPPILDRVRRCTELERKRQILAKDESEYANWPNNFINDRLIFILGIYGVYFSSSSEATLFERSNWKTENKIVLA